MYIGRVDLLTWSTSAPCLTSSLLPSSPSFLRSWTASCYRTFPTTVVSVHVSSCRLQVFSPSTFLSSHSTRRMAWKLPSLACKAHHNSCSLRSRWACSSEGEARGERGTSSGRTLGHCPSSCSLLLRFSVLEYHLGWCWKSLEETLQRSSVC